MMSKIRVALVLFTGLHAANAAALAPPQYIFWAKVKATLTTDPCVTVGDLTRNADATYSMTVAACDATQAKALNQILGRAKAPSTVTLQVAGPDGQTLPTTDTCAATSMADAVTLYKEALGTNPLIVGVSDQNGSPKLWVDVVPMVVQFYADNLGDQHGNMTLVAADAFTQVINTANCGAASAVNVSSAPVDGQ